MQETDPGVLSGLPVDLHVAARTNAQFLCPLAVLGIGIGDMQGTMEAAVLVLGVDHVLAFRRGPVAFLLLSTLGLPSATLYLQHPVVAHQLHRVR